MQEGFGNRAGRVLKPKIMLKRQATTTLQKFRSDGVAFDLAVVQEKVSVEFFIEGWSTDGRVTGLGELPVVMLAE